MLEVTIRAQFKDCLDEQDQISYYQNMNSSTKEVAEQNTTN